jgi:hypothetical protein
MRLHLAFGFCLLHSALRCPPHAPRPLIAESGKLTASPQLSALCQNRARIPWQSGNLPLAQTKRRFYRPNRQPLGNLANWHSGPRALITLSPHHFITLIPRPGRPNPAVSEQVVKRGRS